MSLQLQKNDVYEIILKLADVFNKEKSYLNDLDSKIGDGDHGLSMSRGFNSVADYLKNNNQLEMQDMLSKGGMQFNEVTGSTIGILIFSAMRACSLVIKDKKVILFDDLKKMLEAGIEAIKKRGKAERGQKTILDSLIPVVEYLNSVENTDDERKIIKEAIEIADRSAEETIQMEPQIGRARWFKERSVGVKDPGAHSGYLIINTVGNYILEKFYNK